MKQDTHTQLTHRIVIVRLSEQRKVSGNDDLSQVTSIELKVDATSQSAAAIGMFSSYA